MKVSLVLTLLGCFVCAAFATHGSIANNLFEDDTKDTPHAEIDNLPEEPADIMTERKRNPCLTKKCRRGEYCVVDEDTRASCVCNTDCSFYEKGANYEVCSNKNRTYPTECSLDRDHCLCKHQMPGCSEPGVNKIYLDYYGQCKELQHCSDDAAEQFPTRLRNWLLIVMEDMAKRAADGQYDDIVEKAANDDHHAYAVIWKFCNLDQDPHDSHVSKRELQYTVRSLRAMEGCLVPFLDGCDQNDDRMITLKEWGHCLGLDDGEIKDRCDSIHQYKTK